MTSFSAVSALSEEDFEAWLLKEFRDPHPSLYHDYKDMFHAAIGAIGQWRQRYRGDAALWKRLFDKEHVRKEFIEAVPILDAVVTLVKEDQGTTKFTIVDLACGKGYLSMLLSEMLPPSKVEQCILMDKAWAAHNVTPQPHHMNSEHIYGQYHETWPIKLVTSKQDLKSGRQRRALQKHFFENTNTDQGPARIILLAVHLCGILSLKAVDFFNHNSSIEFFCLKPCCLPGIIHAKRKEQFIFTLHDVSGQQDQQESITSMCHPCHHSFDSALVCAPGKWKKNVWKGPNRKALQTYFDHWAHNLYLGIGLQEKEPVHEDTTTATTTTSPCTTTTKEENDGKFQQGPVATKMQKTVPIQTEGGYQNEFLFAQRCPITHSVWEKLKQSSTPPVSRNADTITKKN